MHANLQTNDNWTTPFSLPFLSISSRDICWNLATVKILIFSGAHHRSTTIHSIVCHRLKKRKRPRSPDFPCKNLANALRNYTPNELLSIENAVPPPPPAPSLERRTRISQSSNTALEHVSIRRVYRTRRALETSLDRENRTEITGKFAIRFTTNSTITCSGRYYSDARVIAHRRSAG